MDEQLDLFPDPSFGADGAPEEGQLVQTGGFRIDRKRALQKLRDFQFADPTMFALSWVRCAVLSGATKVSARAVERGFELSFDGEPLAPESLKEPYAALFDDEPGGERYRHLAVGLLGALRQTPERVSVLSGSGPGRWRLTARSLDEEETLATEPGSADGTVILVEWPKASAAALLQAVSPPLGIAGRALGKLKAECGMLRLPLTLAGKAAPPLPSGRMPAIGFEHDGARGVLEAVEPGKEGRLHFYKHGVRVSSKPLELPLSLDAHVDDPRLRLDASHGQVAQDDRSALAWTSARGQIGPLIRRACEEQRRRCEGRVRDGYTVNGLIGPGALPMHATLARAARRGRSANVEDMAAVESEARAVAWLRHVAMNWSSGSWSQDGETQRALFEAPLYVTVAGRPVNLRQLQRQCDRIGWVPYSDPQTHYPDPWVLGFEPSVDVVWLLDDLDPCLNALFGSKLRRWQARHTVWELAKLGWRKATGRPSGR